MLRAMGTVSRRSGSVGLRYQGERMPRWTAL